MFIKYEPCLKSTAAVYAFCLEGETCQIPCLEYPFENAKKKGCSLRLPIPRVRDIITGSGKLHVHRPGLSGGIIFVSHKP
jgi:hypothetical protein